MQFQTSLPADSEALELVEQGEGLLHHVAELAKALDVRSALAGDHWGDAPALQLAPHGSGVVRLVAQDGFGAASWTARTSAYRRDAVDQVECLRDVVDIGRGRDDVKRDAASVTDQVMFAARLPPVDW